MTFLWRIFLSPFRIVEHTLKYYKHKRYSNAQVSSYTDRQYHAAKCNSAIDDLKTNIPYLCMYVGIQILYYFVI